jgi:hypothetical protein
MVRGGPVRSGKYLRGVESKEHPVTAKVEIRF